MIVQAHLSCILPKNANDAWAELLHVQKLGQPCMLAFEIILKCTDVQRLVDLTIASNPTRHDDGCVNWLER